MSAVAGQGGGRVDLVWAPKRADRGERGRVLVVDTAQTFPSYATADNLVVKAAEKYKPTDGFRDSKKYVDRCVTRYFLVRIE